MKDINYINVITVLNRNGKKIWKTKTEGKTRSCTSNKRKLNTSCVEMNDIIFYDSYTKYIVENNFC